MNPILAPVVSNLLDLVGKYFPSEEEKNKAKLALIQAEQNGELEATKQQLSAILAEGQSADPWTSRARPSFLYVVYVFLLTGIPMGFLSAFKPEFAVGVANGFASWLNAIPEPLYVLFGTGYLGYTGVRGWEKAKGVSK